MRCTFETIVFDVDTRLIKKYVLPYFSLIEDGAWIFHIHFIKISDVRLIYFIFISNKTESLVAVLFLHY